MIYGASYRKHFRKGERTARRHTDQRQDVAGLANGSNLVGIIVPCHRVIGANGSLTGYGSGIERKRWLLEHEGIRGYDAQGSNLFEKMLEA